jgi:hypothetical protein
MQISCVDVWYRLQIKWEIKKKVLTITTTSNQCMQYTLSIWFIVYREYYVVFASPEAQSQKN